jgi:type II secretory pathway component PulJ
VSPSAAARRRAREGGFTLAELLVACALVSLVMAGLLGLQMAGQTTYRAGASRVEAQQSLRVVLDRVVQEIRHAGYCPTCAAGTTPFAAITSQSTMGFTLQNDWDGTWNGASGISASGTVSDASGAVRGERIVYALAGSDLTRQEVGVDSTPVTLARGIASLTLTYRDADGNPTGTAADIRRVDIAVTARPQVQGATTLQGRALVTMTDSVRLRNR